MAKKIAISQSCFLPWRGYFDIIRQVDEFIINDGWQYNWSSWRNRNTIKTPNGLHWLTVPVKRLSHKQTISETQIASQYWREKHWKSICQYYSKAPFFSLYGPEIKRLYFVTTRDDTYLSDINYTFLKELCALLHIRTPITRLTRHETAQDKIQTLIQYCKKFSATHYLTFPNTKAYMDERVFMEAGIAVEWMKYDYSEYLQNYPPFLPNVSIIDTLFHTEHIFS